MRQLRELTVLMILMTGRGVVRKRWVKYLLLNPISFTNVMMVFTASPRYYSPISLIRVMMRPDTTLFYFPCQYYWYLSVATRSLEIPETHQCDRNGVPNVSLEAKVSLINLLPSLLMEWWDAVLQKRLTWALFFMFSMSTGDGHVTAFRAELKCWPISTRPHSSSIQITVMSFNVLYDGYVREDETPNLPKFAARVRPIVVMGV